ncbi:MAG: hypothetical protein NVSMB2_14250 [Chloroflexota bacterium]
MTRLGVLGGTFDPPHFGHLILAQEACWQLDLDRVLFVPAQQNPLKRNQDLSSPETRCAMVLLAIEDNAAFELSVEDIDRPPPSYTVDLLRALWADDRELFFLVGADIVPELPRWYRPDQVLRLARLVIARRPETPAPDLEALDRALPGARDRVDVLDTPGVAISARQVRARVAAHQPIRYLTPASVERYISENGLYRDARL